MAIVANLAQIGDPAFPIDPPLWTRNRSNAGDPNGAVTAQFVGEIILDTTNKKLWQANTIVNTGWVTYNAGPNA